MTKPRGNARTLILYIGEIQDLVGRASADVKNDRDPMMMDKVLKSLETAFNLCVEARDMYEPIDGKIVGRKYSEENE